MLSVTTLLKTNLSFETVDQNRIISLIQNNSEYRFQRTAYLCWITRELPLIPDQQKYKSDIERLIYKMNITVSTSGGHFFHIWFIFLIRFNESIPIIIAYNSKHYRFDSQFMDKGHISRKGKSRSIQTIRYCIKIDHWQIEVLFLPLPTITHFVRYESGRHQ